MTAFVASDLCAFLFSSYLSLNIICINNIFKGAYLPTTRDGSYEQYKRSRVEIYDDHGPTQRQGSLSTCALAHCLVR